MTADLPLAALALFLAHVVKGMTGFGSALIAVPAFTLLWGPATAVATCTACDLLSGLLLLRTSRDVDRRLVAVQVGPLIVGQTLGTSLLLSLPAPSVAGAMSVLVGGFGLSMLWRPLPPPSASDGRPPAPLPAAAVGFLGGLLGGLVGASGPPLIAWGRRHLTAHALRGHLVAVFAIGAASLVLMLAIGGAYDRTTLLRIPLLFPALLLGGMVGTRLAGAASPTTFGRTVGAVLLLAAAGLALRASA